MNLRFAVARSSRVSNEVCPGIALLSDFKWLDLISNNEWGQRWLLKTKALTLDKPQTSELLVQPEEFIE